MNDSGYNKIKELFTPILCLDESTHVINKLQPFKDYVDTVYNDIIKEYPTETTMSMKLLELTKTQLNEQMLEIIFTNLYEYLTLMLQKLEGKGMRREEFLMFLDLSDENYSKYNDRFRKRMQPKRLFPNGIRSFEYLYDIGTNDKVKCYSTNFLKAYKDVIFIPRQGTDIMDISKYYSDIFTALLYEKESDFNNEQYMLDKKIIKSYQLWKYSVSTISQIESIYDLIISSNKKGSDKISQLLFVEKLFGLISSSELLKKEYTQNEYIEIAKSISFMHFLGYSSLHKMIINRISIETQHGYAAMINNYIYPVCSQCIIDVINGIVNYIGRFENEKRIELIKKYHNNCLSKMQCSPLLSNNITYIITKMKHHKKVKLSDDFAVQLTKELLYSPTDNDFDNESKICTETLMRNYSDDYSNIINIDNVVIYDCGIVNLTFGTQYDKNADSIFVLDSSTLDDDSIQFTLKQERLKKHER